MTRAFEQHTPAHVVFGVGSEARVADLLASKGAERVLLVAQSHHRDGADRIARALGSRCVGVLDGVQQHVPEAALAGAVQQARELEADWVVAHGGGSSTGFAKAIALELPVRVAAVVTTYSGSEGTALWGITGPGGKRTGRAPRVRPELVVYDPALTVPLDPKQSLQGLFNALAQATTALASATSEAHVSAAQQAIDALVAALRPLHDDPTSLHARSEALHAAFLDSRCIEQGRLGLQHSLAHTLGGTFHTLHSAAHTASLPYSLHWDLAARPELVALLAPSLGDDPPARLYDLARELGLPHSYKGLDLARSDLPRLVAGVLSRDYAYARPFNRAELIELVDDAFHARRPSLASRRRTLAGDLPHAALKATERGAALSEARAVLIALHGRGAAADRITRDLEAHLPSRDGLCILAPQAVDNAWYPKGFTVPLTENQPALDSALSMLDAAWRAASAAVGPEKVVIAGFSQGACLALAWAATRRASPAALLALSGSELDVGGTYDHLTASTVVLSKSEGDPYLPAERFSRTAEALRAHVNHLTVRVVPGSDHGITDADGVDLAAVVTHVLKIDGD